MLPFISCPRFVFRTACCAALLAFCRVPLCAEPVTPGEYTEFKGGMVELEPGSIIEGSTNYGGIQPDYVLDTWSPQWRPLLDYAREVGRSTETYWGKIDLLLDYVSNRVLPGFDYNNTAYRRLAEEYRLRNENVPLSRYIGIKAGVCRESAFFMHVMLKTAGIANKLTYVRIESSERVEDHTFLVVRRDGEDWVIDSYMENYNGHRLKDLLKPGGPQINDPVAPMRPSRRYRRVLGISEYPKYWIPKKPRS